MNIGIINGGHCMEFTQEIFELIFPQGVFELFDLTEGTHDGATTAITFEERDIPPLIDEHPNHKIVARKFHHITVTDFPLTGRRTRITFRRRYWQVEGQKAYLKRDLKLVFPGTQFEHEFAAFLKEGGRDGSHITGHHCRLPEDLG